MANFLNPIPSEPGQLYTVLLSCSPTHLHWQEKAETHITLNAMGGFERHVAVEIPEFYPPDMHSTCVRYKLSMCQHSSS